MGKPARPARRAAPLAEEEEDPDDMPRAVDSVAPEDDALLFESTSPSSDATAAAPYCISTDASSEHMDDEHLQHRFQAILRQYQDDVFRLVFVVSRPEEQQNLIGRSVNMTSFSVS